MRVSQLIAELQALEASLGDVQVRVYSEDYCCSLHRIASVTDGYFDGWRSHDDVIGINITK